jgi:hypothetical protein
MDSKLITGIALVAVALLWVSVFAPVLDAVIEYVINDYLTAVEYLILYYVPALFFGIKGISDIHKAKVV